MHERERRGGGLQRMAPVVAREAVLAREAGASPVTAREAVVARKDPVASTAAPVALTRPRGSVALGAAPVASTAHNSGGVDVGTRRRRSGATANRGDSGARGGLRDLGEKWWPGGNDFLVKSNLAVARFAKRAIAKIAIAVSAKCAAAIAM